MEETLARQGSSGFDIGSGSFIRRRTENRGLAQQDRTRIVQDAEQRALNLEAQAAGAAGQATLEGNRRFSLGFETILGVGSSLITGATRVNEAAVRRLQLNRLGIN